MFSTLMKNRILPSFISRKLCTAASPLPTSVPNRQVAYWLFGMCGLVGGMVTVGGITRLTRSGLSMTDWKLQGSLPPMNEQEWITEFERYQQFPEWQQRKSMTIKEFQNIYWWEYGHRMLGRSLGVAFILPFTYFSIRGMIPTSLYPRMFGLLALGGGQGLIGWWMVKSGLEVDPNQKKEIRVSPYRLATHLGLAFTTYGLLLWTALDIYYPPSYQQSLAKQFSTSSLQFIQKLRSSAKFNLGLVAFTALSGAYVAGNDAGRAYNTFPMMDDKWIPYEIFDLIPWWKNFFENTAMVQLNHRILALTTYTSLSVMFLRAVHESLQWSIAPTMVRYSMNAVATMAGVQVGLGIYTLLTHVPITMAAAHQAGSLALITCLVGLIHALGYGKFMPEFIPKTVTNAIGKSGKVAKFKPVGSLADIKKRIDPQ